MGTIEVLFMWYTLMFCIGISVYWYLTKTFNHWQIRGVYHIKPLILFGNLKDRMLFRTSFHEMQMKTYNAFKGHKIAGFYDGRRPTLLILDPELLKAILVRDFDHFCDRPTLRFRSSPSYSHKMLISLQGHQWKAVRALMTPSFSSGKLKSMEVLIRMCAKQMEDFLDKTVSTNAAENKIEMKEFFGRFTLDVIASCAFGVQSNSLKEPDGEFIKTMSQFNSISILNRIGLLVVILIAPQLAKYVPLSFMNKKTIRFLGDVVISAKLERLKNPESRRNDFLQLMLDAEVHESEARKKAQENSFTDISETQNNTKTLDNEEPVITEDIVIAQSLLFLIAGFETSSTLLTFASYELALNTDIQEKLRKEIFSVLDKYDGECNYAALSGMNYLEMVLSETLRKHPPVARIDRCCTKEYTVPGTDVTLNPGDCVGVPVFGFHYDPEYYPEPEKFDPERFSNENKGSRPSSVYLPFGAGPRNCLGLRFAMLTTKSAMVHLLRNHKLTVCDKTEVPFQYNKFSMLLLAKNGIWLSIQKL